MVVSLYPFLWINLNSKPQVINKSVYNGFQRGDDFDWIYDNNMLVNLYHIIIHYCTCISIPIIHIM